MSSPKDLVGKTIAGRYQVTGLVGEGAMAVVYRAKQLAGGPDVAVKVMQADLEGDPTFIGRFKREAKSAAKLDHPNTVKIHDFGEEAGQLYMVMELLEGRDLFDLIAKGGALSEPRAVKILVETCKALEAAHALGIVHRDLKPENVYVLGKLEATERVKVLDFGIAKILERDDAPPSGEEEQLTTVGTVVGTPEYMSPEQCMGIPLDARSDIYSCGIVLYQMLTCRPPFYGDSPVHIALAHMELEAPKLRTLVPGVDERLEAIVAKCLAKLPDERFGTAAELRAALEPLVKGVKSAPRRPIAGTSGPVSRATLSRQPIHAPSSGPLSARYSVRGGRVIENPDRAPSAPDGPLSVAVPTPAVITPAIITPPSPLASTMASATERRPAAPKIEVVEAESFRSAPAPAGSAPKLAITIPDEPEEAPITRRSIPFPITVPKPAAAPSEMVPTWKLVLLAVVVGLGGGALAYFLLRS